MNFRCSPLGNSSTAQEIGSSRSQSLPGKGVTKVHTLHAADEAFRQSPVCQHDQRAGLILQAVRTPRLDPESLHGLFQGDPQDLTDVGEPAGNRGHGVEERQLARAVFDSLAKGFVGLFQLLHDPLARGQGEHVPRKEALQEHAHGDQDDGKCAAGLDPRPQVQRVFRLREPPGQDAQARQLAERRELEKAYPQAQVPRARTYEDHGNRREKHEVQAAASHQPHPGKACARDDIHKGDEHPRSRGDRKTLEESKSHEPQIDDSVRQEQGGHPAGEVRVGDGGKNCRQTGNADDNQERAQGDFSPRLEICLRENLRFPADCLPHVLLILRPLGWIRKRRNGIEETLRAFALAHECIGACVHGFLRCRGVQGQDEDPDLGMRRLDAARCRQTVHLRHPDVHQDEMGMNLLRKANDLHSRRGLPYLGPRE